MDSFYTYSKMILQSITNWNNKQLSLYNEWQVKRSRIILCRQSMMSINNLQNTLKNPG